jgi:uncharacterized membrane protein
LFIRDRLCGVAGAAMIAGGLRRGTLGGLATAVAGGFFAYRAVTGYCGMYSVLGLDSAHEGHALFGGHRVHKGVWVKKTFTVNRSPEECYRFWHDFENLPRFMTHLKSVTPLGGRRSRWEARAPLGGTVAWEAEVIEDRPPELISWKSAGAADDVDTAGSVRFRPAPGSRGTEVTVTLQYEPPAGRLGAAVAWLTGEEPSVQVREDLRHFKELMEAGEVPTVEGQPSCRGRD